MLDLRIALESHGTDLNQYLFGQLQTLWKETKIANPTMHLSHVSHHSEQKCTHFCAEWCIMAYGTGALWDFWIWSIPRGLYPCDCQPLSVISTMKQQASIAVIPIVNHHDTLYQYGTDLCSCIDSILLKWFFFQKQLPFHPITECVFLEELLFQVTRIIRLETSSHDSKHTNFTHQNMHENSPTKSPCRWARCCGRLFHSLLVDRQKLSPALWGYNALQHECRWGVLWYLFAGLFLPR